jgi:hypothetical protein
VKKIEFADLAAMTPEQLAYWAERPMALLANCGDVAAYRALSAVVVHDLREEVPPESPESGVVIGYELEGVLRDGRVVTVATPLRGEGLLAEVQARYRAGESLLRAVTETGRAG